MRAISLLVLFLFLSLSHGALADSPSGDTDGLGFALRATLERNPEVLSLRSVLRAEQEGVSEARSGRFPRLSVQASNLNDNVDSGLARLDQPLWTFGKISTAIDRAKASYVFEKLTLLRSERQLLEQAAVAYAQIQGLLARQQVAQADVDEHQGLYDRVSRRMRGGLASEADVRLAYSRLLRSRLQQQSIQGDLQVARNELRAITIAEVAAGQPVDESLIRLPDAEATERLAVENSAEVLRKHAEVEMTRLDVERQKAAYKPDLYARVERDFLDVSPGQDKTRAGLVFESSFDGLGIAAMRRVKGAYARLDAAREGMRATQNDVRRGIANLLANRATREVMVAAQQSSVEAVQETMASFMRQYETGRKSWVEVLNTQGELTEQRFLLEQYRNDWLVLSLRLLSQTGALDQMAGVDPI